MSMVRTPIGISNWKRLLEKSSINKRKLPPKIKLKGIETRLSTPTIILVMCGMIKPNNPITPEIATAEEVASVTANKIINLSLLTWIPEVFASSSPNAITFNFHL